MALEMEDGLDLCDEILELIEELPDAASDFGESIKDKVESMREWIEENETVTPKMYTALENMKAGCAKWLERSDDD
jgi:hypothetical protein